MRAPRRALAVPLALAAVAPALAGCGGNDDVTTSQAAAPPVVTQPPADAVLVERGRIHVEDLGQGWRSDGQAEDPGASACPVPQTADLPADATAISDRFLEDPPPTDALPMTLVQHVFVLPTLAEADAAFAGQVSQEHLTCLRAGLASALQDVVADAGTVESNPWVDLAWPATGDHTVGMGLNLTVRSPDGSTRPVAFAIVVTQLGRGVSVLDISWLRTEVAQQPLVQALGASAARLAAARAAPDDRAA